MVGVSILGFVWDPLVNQHQPAHHLGPKIFGSLTFSESASHGQSQIFQNMQNLSLQSLCLPRKKGDFLLTGSFYRFTLQGTITYPTMGSSENHRLKSAFLEGICDRSQQDN